MRTDHPDNVAEAKMSPGCTPAARRRRRDEVGNLEDVTVERDDAGCSPAALHHGGGDDGGYAPVAPTPVLHTCREEKNMD